MESTNLKISYKDANTILSWVEIAEDQHLGVRDADDLALILKMFEVFPKLQHEHPLLYKISREEPVTDEEAILLKNGWTIECWSPFEIRHQDGSFATQIAARTILEALKRGDKSLDCEEY